jgi:cell wall-associated NlpC family hydrolase
MWRSLFSMAILVLFLAGCSSPESSRTMRTGISPNQRYTTPETTRPSPGGVPVVGESAWRSEATKWIGVPYRTGGTTRAGMDCSGLVCRMYENVARIQLPRTSFDQSRIGVSVLQNQLRPGDLVFFQTSARPEINHAGIYLGDGRFVHSSTSHGVIYSTLKEPYYIQTYRGARRILR